MPRSVFVALTLAILTLAFGRFFAGTSFTQDDFVWLCFSKFNPQPLSILWRDTLCGQFFRPMGQMWWQAIYWVAGDTLWPYQVAFLLTHLANGLLVGLLAAHFAGTVVGRLSGLLFVLSPLFVASLSGHYLFIFDVLGFFFFALSLVCVARLLRTGRCIFGVMSLMVAMGAFLSKESYFTLPIVVLAMVGLDEEFRWHWCRVKRHLIWVSLHASALLLAIVWRTVVIEAVGGYGIVEFSGPSRVLTHLVGRVVTWIGFSGWSLFPLLARWAPSDAWPFFGSVLLLGALTAALCKLGRGRAALWSWLWMAATWSPSMIMTTHAPVSWYPCTFGTVLLASLVIERLPRGYIWGMSFAIFLSMCSLVDYSRKIPNVAKLRDQQRRLAERFPLGGATLPEGHRYFLLNCAFDLYPDPIVKLGTPRGSPMHDVMFFNSSAPVGWVIMNPHGYDVWPMRTAPMFQRPYMDIIDYHAVPLVFPHRDVLLGAGPRFHFLRWSNDSLVDITDQLSVQPDRPHKGRAR